MLEELLRDLTKEYTIATISNGNAIAEVAISNLPIKISDEWIRIGVEGESHIHLKKSAIKFIQFLREEKSNGRIIFSVRLLDKDKERILSIYFIDMYEGEQLKVDRIERYESIFKKHGSRDIIELVDR